MLLFVPCVMEVLLLESIFDGSTGPWKREIGNMAEVR